MRACSLVRQRRCCCAGDAKSVRRAYLQDSALGLLLVGDGGAGVEDSAGHKLLAETVQDDHAHWGNAYRMASSKTLLRFLWVKAEHSRYL